MDRIRLIAIGHGRDPSGRVQPAAAKVYRRPSVHWPGRASFVCRRQRAASYNGTMFPDLEEIILIGDNGGAARWKRKDLFVSEMPAEAGGALAGNTKQAGDGCFVACEAA